MRDPDRRSSPPSPPSPPHQYASPLRPQPLPETLDWTNKWTFSFPVPANGQDITYLGSPKYSLCYAQLNTPSQHTTGREAGRQGGGATGEQVRKEKKPTSTCVYVCATVRVSCGGPYLPTLPPLLGQGNSPDSSGIFTQCVEKCAPLPYAPLMFALLTIFDGGDFLKP